MVSLLEINSIKYTDRPAYFEHLTKLYIFSLNELVQHGQNGFVFESPKELAQQILTWFHDFPNNITLVNVKEVFNQKLREFQQLRWDDNWNQHALPAFLP